MIASARARGVARLGGEAGAELGRGVLAGHHEQVVERGDGAPHANTRQALIEPVEQIGASRSERLSQQAAAQFGGSVAGARADSGAAGSRNRSAVSRVRGGQADRISREYRPTPESSSPTLYVASSAMLQFARLLDTVFFHSAIQRGAADFRAGAAACRVRRR